MEVGVPIFAAAATHVALGTGGGSKPRSGSVGEVDTHGEARRPNSLGHKPPATDRHSDSTAGADLSEFDDDMACICIIDGLQENILVSFLPPPPLPNAY